MKITYWLRISAQLYHQDSLSAACSVPPTGGGEAALVSCSSVANASSGHCE